MTADAEAAFTTFAAKFLAEYLEHAPTRATEAGEHRFDGRWPDVSPDGDVKDRAWAEAKLKELAAIPRDKLGLQSRVDHDIWYAEHASVALDIAIIVRTPIELLRNRNVY